MSEFVYKDYMPANARVLVDYKAHEKVKFAYPREWTYKKAVKKNVRPAVIGFWVMLNTYILYYFGINFLAPFMLVGVIIKFFQQGAVIQLSGVISRLVEPSTIEIGFPIILFIVYLFIPPYLFTFWFVRDKERVANWMPKLGYWANKLGGGWDEKIFTPADVHDKKAIIPVFGNIFLDYKTKGEFNDYLEKIEIIEFPFIRVRKYLFADLLRRKITREKNDIEFRAIFYFSKKPKTGELRVEFV